MPLLKLQEKTEANENAQNCVSDNCLLSKDVKMHTILYDNYYTLNSVFNLKCVNDILVV